VLARLSPAAVGGGWPAARGTSAHGVVGSTISAAFRRSDQRRLQLDRLLLPLAGGEIDGGRLVHDHDRAVRQIAEEGVLRRVL